MVISIGKHVNLRDTGLILPEHVAASRSKLSPDRTGNLASRSSREVSLAVSFFTPRVETFRLRQLIFRYTCLCMGLKTFDGWILQKLSVFRLSLRLIAGVAGYPPDCAPSRGTPMPRGLHIGGDFTLLSHRAKQRYLDTNISELSSDMPALKIQCYPSAGDHP